MQEHEIVLAAASTYDKKYYFNDDFITLPQQVKNELRTICILHTADVGGTIAITFNELGNVEIQVNADEEDVLYDEIGSHLRVKRIQKEHKELWEALGVYFNLTKLGGHIL